MAIIPKTKYELNTTRSPMFLRREPTKCTNVWSKKLEDQDVVVSVIIHGFGWRVQASTAHVCLQFLLNKKEPIKQAEHSRNIIAIEKLSMSRVFYRGNESVIGKINEQTEYNLPRDQDGHGTHIATTVVSPMHDANLLRYALPTTVTRHRFFLPSFLFSLLPCLITVTSTSLSYLS